MSVGEPALRLEDVLVEAEGRALLRAVATDGHRLARVETPAPAGASGMPGVIVPRKAVAEIQKLLEGADGEVEVQLSATKIKVSIGDVVLTSKLIDGTFPDYERVIPRGNDKVLKVAGTRPPITSCSAGTAPR